MRATGEVAHHEGVDVVACIEDCSARAKFGVIDRVPHAVIALEDARISQQQVHADSVGRDNIALDVGVAPPCAVNIAAQRGALAVDRRADEFHFVGQLGKQDVCPVHTALHMHRACQAGWLLVWIMLPVVETLEGLTAWLEDETWVIDGLDWTSLCNHAEVCDKIGIVRSTTTA